MALFAEGPIPKGKCQECNRYCVCDIYRYRGRVLCGDCRYEARSGKRPRHEPDHCENLPSEDPGGAVTGELGSETLHRTLEFEAFSERHVAFINEWIDSFTLSLE